MAGKQDDLEQASAKAFRRWIAPIFKGLGFQRITKSVCERWDGGEIFRPDRYLRLYLAPSPRHPSSDPTKAFSIEVSVYHPRLEHGACATRLDSRGRYSPRIAEVFRPRHVLVLWPDSETPLWEARLGEIDELYERAASAIQSSMVPAIMQLSSFEREIARHVETAPLTPDAIRARLANSGKSLQDTAFNWCTTAQPACFFDPAIKSPRDLSNWRNPEVTALLEEARSARYTAALAEMYGSSEIARQLRESAAVLEEATGISLIGANETSFLSLMAG